MQDNKIRNFRRILLIHVIEWVVALKKKLICFYLLRKNKTYISQYDIKRDQEP